MVDILVALLAGALGALIIALVIISISKLPGETVSVVIATELDIRAEYEKGQSE